MAIAVYEGDDPAQLPNRASGGYPTGGVAPVAPATPQAPVTTDAGLSAPTSAADPGAGVPSEPADSGGTTVMPPDLVGDIPPPPIPQAPRTGQIGLGGGAGPGGSTFARPGTIAAKSFRSVQAQAPKLRFGPGVPTAGAGVSGGGNTGFAGGGGAFGGGAPGGVAGLPVPGGEGGGLSPEEAAELLQRLAATMSQGNPGGL